MARVRIISATGRLKNKIDFSYEVSIGLYESVSNGGMIYTADPAMLTGIVTLPTGITLPGIYSTTFTGIPNGTYYVKAYVVEEISGLATYSAAQTVFVTDKGYEISTDAITIANPLVISDGSEGVEKVLTSDSSGLSKWKPVKSLFTFGHYIGELYGGGIVVDVWKEGDDEKILIASLEDLSFDYYNGDTIDPRIDFDWNTGIASITAIGPLAQSLYNGKQNTDAIIAQTITLGTVYNGNGYAGSAAQVCAAYRGGGYEDWYLPAYYEVNSIYNQSAIINKVLKKESAFIPDKDLSSYWSSTECSSSPTSTAYICRSGNLVATGKMGRVAARIRAVRKESVYTGDGLCLNLDATNIKSFDDIRYSNGMESRWVDLVNGGMTSSYSFMPAAWPSVASGGTLIEILPGLETLGGNSENLALRRVGTWMVDKVSGSSTPWLYNNTGVSSMVSDLFTIPTQTNTFYYMKFDTIDVSTVKSPTKAVVNVYVSVNSGAYTLVREVTNTVGDNNNGGGGGNSVIVSLSQFKGKSVSIKITAPNAYYVNSANNAGPAVDNIYVYSATGGYQPSGPIYLPSESGFLRFNGTGSMVTESTSYGSYFDIKAPIGNATTVTVEIWMRMKDGYQTRMPFAWSKYSIFTGDGGGLGFNTGVGDLFGINSTKVRSLGIVEKWAHFVFEMRSDVSYTNNKMYINGNEQVLSQVAGNEEAFYRNFNGGLGRIGGWRSPDNNKLYLFRGDISVVRIYNRALTKDEIMKNYSTEKKKYEILPKLLENNLFTSIDFDNIASFSGDGTITREVVDLSGNSRNASLIISGTTIKPSVRRTNSLYNGRELVFPGEIATNPYLSWPDSVAIQSLQNISVSFWIKIGINRTSEIIVKWNSSTGTIGPWEVYQSSSTTIAIRLKGQLSSAPYQVDRFGSKQIALNKWTHVCATYDNTTKNIKTYIDSVLDIDSSAPFGFSISTGITGEICVGRYVTENNQYYPFQGSIASIQIYNKPLTSGEIKNNYDADKFRFDNFNDASKFYSHEISGNPTFSIYENLVLDVSGKSNEKLLSSDSEGKTSWVDKSYFFNRPINYRYIGELYGGGIIVAMWKYPSTVFNYLIMSLEDVSDSTTWGNVSAATASTNSIHNGAANTNGIIAQNGHLTSAAKLCRDYRGGGFSDWYLPSLGELNHAFNAVSVVDTVLGSDLLKGTYWTSTEINSTTAYSYTFESDKPVGSLVNDGSSKKGLLKVRAFRLAQVNERRRWWELWWERDYTPLWWGDGGSWWGEENFIFRTTIEIGIPTRSQSRYITGSVGSFLPYRLTAQPAFSFDFFSTITTNETIIRTGVCWSTASATPTILNSLVYSSGQATGADTGYSGGKIYISTTPYIYGAPVGTLYNEYDLSQSPIVYYRAFVETPTGVYYSSNSGSNFQKTGKGATYSTSPTSYAYWPTGCYIAAGYFKSLYE